MEEASGVKRVGVIGLGRMGGGIAQVAAQAGYMVKAMEQDRALLDRGLEGIRKSLQRLIQKGSLQEKEGSEIFSRIQGTNELESLADCDLVIEAVFEDLDVKKSLFRKLDQICPPETLLTTNTSSLSVTTLSSKLTRMDKFLGLHFFNPVQVMQLVEVIKTVTSSEEAIKTLMDFVRSLKKRPILVRDQAGFLVNYLLTPYLFDAIRALSAGVSSVQEIDDAMRYGCGHPMGPLALCDLIGLDILLNAGNTLYADYHDGKYAPPPLLRRLVELGDLGMKSGRGFYDYRQADKPRARSL